jgi:transcriptional regulator with XRE-family HTH domain
MPERNKNGIPTENVYRRELAERISHAFRFYNASVPHNRVLRQLDFARLVSRKLGLKEPFTQPAVSQWMNPDNPHQPDNPTLMAIAEVLKVDPYWLIFGDRRVAD